MPGRTSLKKGVYQNPNSERSKESIDRYVRGMRDKKYGGKRINTDRIRKFKTGMTPGGTDLEKAKEATKLIRDKKAQKRMKNSRPGKKGSSITDIFKSYGKYDGKPIELKGGGMSAGQAKIAAKAPPPNKIDEKDFAVLRAEKAKGRGMGLQDEKVKPGKVQKANLGLMFMKRAKDKGAKGLEFLSPLAMLKRVSGRKAGGVAKYKRGMGPGGLDLPVISSVKPGSKIGKGTSEHFSKSNVSGHKRVKGKKTTLEQVRKEKGFKPGETPSQFNKRRMALEVGKKALKATTVGKIALGVGTVGVAAQQYLKSKMKKKDEPKKKMGGGMMQKPMGYSKGTMIKARGCKLGRTRPTKIT